MTYSLYHNKQRHSKTAFTNTNTMPALNRIRLLDKQIEQAALYQPLISNPQDKLAGFIICNVPQLIYPNS